MAAQAENPENQSEELEPHQARVMSRRAQARTTAARLYSNGHSRHEVARLLAKHIIPFQPDMPVDRRLTLAIRKLKLWEFEQDFRDMVYEGSVVQLDMETPAILKGVARKAKGGRVDAAKLALELTGRHTSKGEQAPTQIAIVLNGVPRPQIAVPNQAAEVVEGTVEADEDV